MKEKSLREALEKCSKAELMQIIIKASEFTYAAFPWIKMISEIKLGEIEAKIDANLAESKKLTNKLNETIENQHDCSDEEVLKLRIALVKNHKEWERLNMNYNKISKELYG